MKHKIKHTKVEIQIPLAYYEYYFKKFMFALSDVWEWEAV